MNEKNYKIKISANGVEIEVGGDKEFVESKFNSLKKELFSHEASSVAKKVKKQNIGEEPKEENFGNTSLIDFVNSKKPKSTATELMPVLVYYAKHYKNLDKFNKSDVKNLYKTSGNIKKQPKNIYQAMVDISRNSGYFENVPKAKGYFRINEAGEYFVEV